MKKIGK